MENNSLQRIDYLDRLRIFASFGVMIIHISAQNWYSTDVNGFEWQVFNFFDSISRWAVPVFVMISGALFLNREVSIKKIFSKYVLRLAVAYIVWNFIYKTAYSKSISFSLKTFLEGHYHMWFIPMMIGLYICLPITKEISKNRTILIYFLILSFTFASFIPSISYLSTDFFHVRIQKWIATGNSVISEMKLQLVLGYSGYFLLGYFLNKSELSSLQRKIIYILGVIGFAATVILDSVIAIRTQKPCDKYYWYFCLFVMLESLAVFTFFKYTTVRNEKINSLISALSKYSLGAYLVHALIIDFVKKIGLETISFNPIISVPLIGLIVFIISYTISGILNKIPVVKKFIV